MIVKHDAKDNDGKIIFRGGKPLAFQSREEEVRAYKLFVETGSMREVSEKYNVAINTISKYISLWAKDKELRIITNAIDVKSAVRRLEDEPIGKKGSYYESEDDIMNRPNPQKIDKYTLNDKSQWNN